MIDNKHYLGECATFYKCNDFENINKVLLSKYKNAQVDDFVNVVNVDNSDKNVYPYKNYYSWKYNGETFYNTNTIINSFEQIEGD